MYICKTRQGFFARRRSHAKSERFSYCINWRSPVRIRSISGQVLLDSRSCSWFSSVNFVGVLVQSESLSLTASIVDRNSVVTSFYEDDEALSA